MRRNKVIDAGIAHQRAASLWSRGLIPQPNQTGSRHWTLAFSYQPLLLPAKPSSSTGLRGTQAVSFLSLRRCHGGSAQIGGSMVRHLPRSFCVCGAVGVLVSEFFHIRVQSRSGDPHKVTDFFHGMAACPVQVHCVCSLAWIEAFCGGRLSAPGRGPPGGRLGCVLG